MLQYSYVNCPYDAYSNIYINNLLQIQIYSDVYVVFNLNEVTGQFSTEEISHKYSMKNNKKNKNLIRRALYGYMLEVKKRKSYS